MCVGHPFMVLLRRQNSDPPTLDKIPYFSSPKSKCSVWKSGSFSDSLFQIKGFKLTCNHVSAEPCTLLWHLERRPRQASSVITFSRFSLERELSPPPPRTHLLLLLLLSLLRSRRSSSGLQFSVLMEQFWASWPMGLQAIPGGWNLF